MLMFVPSFSDYINTKSISIVYSSYNKYFAWENILMKLDYFVRSTNFVCDKNVHICMIILERACHNDVKEVLFIILYACRHSFKISLHC